MKKYLPLLLLASLLATAHAQFVSTMPDKVMPIDPKAARSFVGCPIFRNTERQSWLAKEGDTLYYIDPGTGYRPQLGFRVLVEGEVSPGPKIGGGIVLNPVHVSVLAERAPECNTILPADGFASPPAINNFGYVKHADDPPLPKFKPGEVLPLPAPPFNDLHYTVYFPYNRAFLPEGITEVIVESAAAYIRASEARHVRVVGYAGDALLDNKRVMHERKTVAEERADLVASALEQLGVDPAVIIVDWQAEAAPGDGVHDPDHRKAVIDIHL